MKKIYTILFACIAFISVQATSYTIAISGTAYSPNTLTVSVGDVVTIQASTMHPLAQVDATTWNANGTTTVTGGWGTQTADYTFTVSSTNPIYFVCTMHVSLGMKGLITVESTGIKVNTSAIETFAIFPIPATDKINMSYSLNQTSFVKIDLVGLNGQLVACLVNELQTAGTKKETMTVPSNVSSGVYLLKVTSNGNKAVERLITIK